MGRSSTSHHRPTYDEIPVEKAAGNAVGALPLRTVKHYRLLILRHLGCKDAVKTDHEVEMGDGTQKW